VGYKKDLELVNQIMKREGGEALAPELMIKTKKECQGTELAAHRQFKPTKRENFGDIFPSAPKKKGGGQRRKHEKESFSW